MSFEEKRAMKSLPPSPSTDIKNTRSNQIRAKGRNLSNIEKMNYKTGIDNERKTTSGGENNKRMENSSTTARTSSSAISRPSMIMQLPIRIVRKTAQNSMVQKFMSIPVSICLFLLIKKVFLHHKSLENFFVWMEEHPNKGMAAYLIIYPFHMLLFFPGTPLVMGAGYIFTIRFGWLIGISLCSIITLFGSLIGSIMCFLVGRYCMRSTVRRWSKKYPLFDPIDAAVSVNSFKIMALLYLTPVIPLGPLSYVMGTTSMPLISFAKAKIAALPLTVLYVYLGAATGTLVAAAEEGMDPSNENSTSKGMGKLQVDPKLVVFGIIFSVFSIAVISIKMKQELHKILNKQNEDEEILNLISGDLTVEDNGGNISKRTKTRQRVKAPRQIKNSGVDDVEVQKV